MSKKNKDNLKWWILLTVILGTFLGRLDGTIVNLALPKMIEDFNVTVSAAGWISTAYILANAVFVPIWGKLGDTIGRKKVYLFGFAIFILGSVLAGIAWNYSSMIFFRVIQAIASSADYPTAMAIIAATFPEGKERAQALGIWSSSFAAAVVFGPLIGGPLIDNFGWRSVFLVNLPIGLLGIVMALTFIHESVSEKKTMIFDWWGAITLGVSLSALVLVLDKGLEWGWLSFNSILTYAIVIIFGIIFYYAERKCPEPIVDLSFFKNSIFVNTMVNNFVVFMGLMGSVFLIPIFASTFLGLDATQTGYLFIPMAMMMMLSSPLGGRFTGRVQPRYIIFISTLVAAIGLYLFSFLDPRSTVWDIILPLGLMAFGLGFGMAQRTNIIASIVEPHEIGIASSVLALVRNIAGAFGIALFGTILNNTINSNVLNIAQSSVLNIHNSLATGQFIGLITLKAQVSAYNYVFVISSIFLFVGAFLSLMIKVKEKEGAPEVVMVE
ncbi:MAG: DHA2 family efflux MFS transporter permease subunit [Patescibacteria group bacterium]|nr:DHA2 family efflux MFS transporter permease subunit [Patescibacteria group bacterium]MDD4610643.1 DHA2 family efflux MFS transporter permease subunit [Patescibacteria group bacterium]